MDGLGQVMGDRDHDGQPDAAAIVGGLLGQFGAAAGTGDGTPSPTNAVAGIGPLVEHLQQSGLAAEVASWVAKGDNKPVDAQRLGSALGPDKLGQLAAQVGVPIDQLLPALAAALPTVIDALTPDGNVPGGGGGADIGSILGGLGGMFGGNKG
jgi:uncharacterized protein YidB (DUF937 family)